MDFDGTGKTRKIIFTQEFTQEIFETNKKSPQNRGFCLCKLRLSEIENDLLKIIRKYEGTNLWLSINE